jgi:serpin B
MKKMMLITLVIVILLPLLACTQPVQASVLKSEKPRLASSAGTSDVTALTEGNNAFALDLYGVLKDQAGNLFFSPYSLSQTLAMTWAGARGETEQQMSGTLQFKLQQAQLHAAFNSLDLELAKRGQGAKGKDDKGFRLHIINAIWGQAGFKFQADYLDLLAQDYGAGLRTPDFIKETDKSRLQINQWASDQTEGKIKDLLPPGTIGPLTRMVLTNAIYFNAAWQYQFKKEYTNNADFTLLAGSRVNVPMMHLQQSFAYSEGADYQAVELPYDGRELSMVIILPQTGSYQAFEAALNSRQVNTIIQDLKSSRVNISMPRFTFESQFNLKKALSGMGMTSAFSASEADFSGMDGTKDLFIQDVVHKAFVAVDETGTEAAAVSAVIMMLSSAPIDEPKEVKLDHPFIFLIRDMQTNSILFLGRVMNPQ